MPSIDQRIVEMQFDNSQFERGAAQSIQTLRNLDKQINNTSGKGLLNFKDSINSVDFSSLYRGLSGIADKFSPIQVAGRRVVENLTDMAMSAFGKITGGVTSVFDEIDTRGTKRAANLEQARFQLKGLFEKELGAEKAAKRVEEIIKGPVDKAVSGTRFGLDEAAVAASMLAASGIQDLDEMGNALLGISGAATMTGREYSDIANIFTTVAGQGKLMTMQLRQFEASGLNVAADLAKAMGKTEAQIREMVTKGQISFKQFATVINENYGEHATKANETYAGSLANVYAQLGKIGEVVKTFERNSLIPVNVAQINYLKALKKNLDPIFNIINRRQQRKANFLKEFFEDPRLLTASKVLIKAVDRADAVFRIFAKDVKKALKSIFGESDILRELVIQVYHLYYALFDFVEFLKKSNRPLKDDNVLASLKNIVDNVKAAITSLKETAEIVFRAITTAFTHVFGDIFQRDGSKALTTIESLSENFKQFAQGILDWTKNGGFNVLVDIFTNIFKAIRTTIETIVNLSGKVGSVLGSVVSTASGIIQKLVPVIQDVFSVIKSGVDVFAALGDALSPIIDFAGSIGTFVLHRFEDLAKGIHEISEATKDFGKGDNAFVKIAKGITGVISLVQNAANKIVTFIKKIVNSVDVDLTLSWDTFFKAIEVISKAAIFNKIADSIKVMVTSFKSVNDVIESGIKTVNSVVDIPNKVSNVLGGLSRSLNEFVHTIKATSLLITAAAIMLLASAITKLADADPQAAADSVASLSVLLMSTMTAVKILSTSAPSKGILKTAIAFTIIAGAVKKLAKALVIVAGQDQDAIMTSAMVLSLLMRSVRKTVEAMDGVKIKIGTAVALAVYAETLKILVKALGKLTDIVSKDLGGSVVAFVMLELLMSTLANVAKKLEKISSEMKAGEVIKMIGVTVALNLFVRALYPVILSIAALTALLHGGVGQVVGAFAMVEVILGSLVGMLGMLEKQSNNTKSALRLIGVVLALKMFVYALIPVVASIAAITGLLHLDPASTLGAFAIVEMILFSLVGVIKQLKETLSGGDIKSMVSDAGNMAAAIGAIEVLVKALAVMVGEIAVLTGLIALNADATVGGFAVLEAMMWSLMGVLEVATRIADSNKEIKAIYASVGAMALIILALGPAVTNIAILAAVGPKAVLGLAVVEVLVWSLVGVMEVLKLMTKKIRDTKKILTAVGMMAVIIAAIGLVIPQIIAVSLLGPLAIAGLLTFEVLLWSMIGALAVMNLVTKNGMNTKGILAAAGAIAVMALALSVFMPQMVALSVLGTGALIGAAALAAIMAVFIAAGAVAGNFPLVASGLMLLAGGIAAVSGAFLILGMAVTSIALGTSMLVDSIIKLGQSADAIGDALGSINESINKHKADISAAIDNLIDLSIESMKVGVPRIIRMVGAWVVEVVKALHDSLPQIVEEFAGTIVDVAEAIVENADKIVTAAVDIIEAIVSGLEKNMSRLIDCAFRLIISFINGIADAIDKNGDKLKAALKHLLHSIIAFFIGDEAATKLMNAAETFIGNFIDGAVKFAKGAWDKIVEIGTAIVDFFKKAFEAGGQFFEDIGKIGENLIQGFIDGIANFGNKVWDTVTGIGSSAIGALKNVLGIASPSKVFRQLGIYTIQGFIQGIDYSSKDAVKRIQKFGQDVAKEAKEAVEGTVLVSADLTKLNQQLEVEKKELSDINKRRKEELSWVKAYNKELKQVYYDTKSNRKLTKDQQAELKFLQNELYRTGKLSDAQLRRMGKLLGMTKAETKELNKTIKERKKHQKEYDKITKEYKQQAAYVALINKEIAAGGSELSSVELYEYQQRWAEGFKKLGAEIYKNTQEYKDNKLAIEQNKELQEAYTKEKEKQIKVVAEDKKVLASYNNALSGHYAIMKGVKGLTKAQQTELASLQSKMKSGQQLTAKEIALLGKYLGLSKDQIKILKETNQNGIAQLAYMKSKAKLSKEESKTLSELQTKMKKGKELSDEEVLNLAKLLGLSKAQTKQLKIELGVRKQYTDKLTEDKNTLAQLNQAVRDCKTNNKDLTQAIKDGAVPALTDFYNTIKSNLENALNPFNTALSDSIDLFSKFAATAVEADLDTFLKVKDEDYDKRQALIEQLSGRNINSAIMAQLKESDLDTLTQWASLTDAEIANINHKFNMGLVENIDSFGSAYDEWREKFAELEAKGFNQAIIDRVRALGPAGLEIVKQYLGFTEEEINAANAAIIHSTNATFDEWLETNKQKIAQQEKFLNDLNVAVEKYGLSSEAYRSFLEQGYESAGAIVEGMLTGTSEAEVRKKVESTNSIFSSKNNTIERLATESVQGAAAAMAGAGSELFTEFFNGFTNGYMMDEEKYKAGSAAIKNMVKTILKQSQKATEEASEKAGTKTGTVYIDGMTYAIDDKG